MVGVRRFELPTSWSRTKRANRAALHPDRCVNTLPAGEGECQISDRIFVRSQRQKVGEACTTGGVPPHSIDASVAVNHPTLFPGQIRLILLRHQENLCDHPCPDPVETTWSVFVGVVAGVVAATWFAGCQNRPLHHWNRD